MTSTRRPSISVLTPSYQYGRFLEDAILSVREQPGDISHFVQDGASTDSTLEVLKRCQSDRLAWVSEVDEGQSDALNRALQATDGEWVAWLNADEFLLPDAYEGLLSIPDLASVDVIYGDAVFVDVKGRLQRLVPQHRYSSFVLRKYGPFISTCAVMFRRSLVTEFHWRPGLKRIMDWDLFLHLDKVGARFAYVPHPVGAFRVHPDQVTAGFAEDHRSEYEAMHTAYGTPLTWRRRQVGRVVHVLQKLTNGSYWRQRQAQIARGSDLRWFDPAVGRSSFEGFLDKAYRRSNSYES